MTNLRTDSTHSGINIDYANGSGFVHGGSGPLTVYSNDKTANATKGHLVLWKWTDIENVTIKYISYSK